MQEDILEFCKGKKSVTIRELCVELDMKQVCVNRMVLKLEKYGLIKVTRVKHNKRIISEVDKNGRIDK